jgi:DNA-binding IclR family transcriptional regulator
MNTAHPELMRAINRYLVLNEIRKNRRISRVEIAERTMLSRATVSAIVDALIGEGLIGNCGESGPGGQRGRPRIRLRLTSSV